ncbi:MAG: small multi-drug export protein [Candidatus Omnitrophica bacterium]|nr:small multi-drug export protein [Candidatus Omnitrophota bacterium]
MISAILEGLKNTPRDLIVMLVAALPIAELRGAIPLAWSMGMSMQKAFWLSVIGNALPVIPILFLLKPVSAKLSRLKVFKRFFDWLFERTMKKANTVQKWETLGLAILVAIPLPMTGAWTGAIAASLLKMRLRYALIGCILGILGAGVIVTILCALGIMSWKAVTQ